MKLRLINTSEAYPEQYGVFDKNSNQVAYMRLRWSYFSVRVPDVDGEEIYHAYTDGDGHFTDEERNFYIESAKIAIRKYYNSVL